MKLNKTTLAIVIGNALEYYDFMLYGFFATILAPLFFPHENPTLSLIASMASYGVGFLARPLGGLFFGHLGDRWGRKNTFSLSLLLVTIPTLCIGLLPSYQQIGIWAPILLVMCRLLLGFCLGGETSGAMTYMIEHTSPHHKDKSSAWLVASCYAGTLLGTLLGSLFTLPFMPSWGWRLTFIAGSFITIIGYYIRRRLHESPEFLSIKKEGSILDLPLKSLLKNEKLNLFYSAGLSSAVIVPFITIFIYLNSLMTKNLHFPASQVLLFNALLMLLWMGLLLLAGALAQRFGRHLIMTTGAIGMGLVAMPLFLMIGSTPSFATVLTTQLVLSIFACAYSAPTSAFLVSLFPINQRYSGIAFGYSLGHAIFGGVTPMCLTLCVQSFDLDCVPALFIIFSCILGILALRGGANADEKGTGRLWKRALIKT